MKMARGMPALTSIQTARTPATRPKISFELMFSGFRRAAHSSDESLSFQSEFILRTWRFQSLKSIENGDWLRSRITLLQDRHWPACTHAVERDIFNQPESIYRHGHMMQCPTLCSRHRQESESEPLPAINTGCIMQRDRKGRDVRVFPAYRHPRHFESIWITRLWIGFHSRCLGNSQGFIFDQIWPSFSLPSVAENNVKWRSSRWFDFWLSKTSKRKGCTPN
jgi:hypothetical protein